MMKRKTIVWTLILLLVLGALSGCKQENSLESAAPGDVVEKPEMDLTEQDTLVAGNSVEEKKEEPEEKTEEPADQEQGEKQEETTKSELFICEFLIRIKDEFVPKNYDESDFSEISISDYSVKTFLYPDGAEEPCASEIIITSEMNNWEQVMLGFNSLKKRSDIQSMSLAYEAYMIDSKEATNLPDLKRATFEFDNTEYTDGVIVVELKEDIAVSPLLFEEFDIDGLTGELSVNPIVSPQIKLYLKERGHDELSRLITKLENMDFITCAGFDQLIYYSFD